MICAHSTARNQAWAPPKTRQIPSPWTARVGSRSLEGATVASSSAGSRLRRLRNGSWTNCGERGALAPTRGIGRASLNAQLIIFCIPTFGHHNIGILCCGPLFAYSCIARLGIPTVESEEDGERLHRTYRFGYISAYHPPKGYAYAI